MSKPVPKRPLTDDERAAAKAVQRCTMPVGSWDKRFTRDILSWSLDTGQISERSAAQLWRLFVRYRRQIDGVTKTALMPIAEKFAAPDFRKQQAAANEQARIDAMKAAAEKDPAAYSRLVEGKWT